MAEIRILKNANVYVDGNNFLGKVREFELPTINQKTDPHEVMGLIGTPEFSEGLEPMEATFSWASFYSDVYQKIGNPMQAVQLQVRGSAANYTANGRTSETAVVVHMTVNFKTVPMGTFTPKTAVELESTASVHAIKLEIGGVVVLEIDVLANIYKVNGLDIMAEYRNNLGL